MTRTLRSRPARLFAIGLAVLLLAGCSPAEPSGATTSSSSPPPAVPELRAPGASVGASPSGATGFVPLGPLPLAALDEARAATMQEALDVAIRGGAPT